MLRYNEVMKNRPKSGEIKEEVLPCGLYLCEIPPHSDLQNALRELLDPGVNVRYNHFVKRKSAYHKPMILDCPEDSYNCDGDNCEKSHTEIIACLPCGARLFLGRNFHQAFDLLKKGHIARAYGYHFNEGSHGKKPRCSPNVL